MDKKEKKNEVTFCPSARRLDEKKRERERDQNQKNVQLKEEKKYI